MVFEILNFHDVKMMDHNDGPVAAAFDHSPRDFPLVRIMGDFIKAKVLRMLYEIRVVLEVSVNVGAGSIFCRRSGFGIDGDIRVKYFFNRFWVNGLNVVVLRCFKGFQVSSRSWDGWQLLSPDGCREAGRAASAPVGDLFAWIGVNFGAVCLEARLDGVVAFH